VTLPLLLLAVPGVHHHQLLVDCTIYIFCCSHCHRYSLFHTVATSVTTGLLLLFKKQFFVCLQGHGHHLLLKPPLLHLGNDVAIATG